MMYRALLVGTALAAMTVSAQAEVTYDYVGYFRLTNHETAVRFATGVADDQGGLFFGDNGTDHIYYVTDILGTLGQETSLANVPLVSSDFGFAGGSSWQNTSYVDGNYFISGRSNTAPPFTQTVRATILNSPPTGPADWLLDSYFPDGEFGGIAAINPNLVAMADFATGAISFFDLTGGSATLVGSPIAGSGYFTPSLDYDPVAGKLYAYMVANEEIGGVAVFNTNGTAAGTTYLGTNPLIPTKPTSWTIVPGTPPTFTFSSYYSQLAVNPATSQLLVGFSQGTFESIGAKFQVFDVSAPAPSLLFDTDGSDIVVTDGNESLIEGRFNVTRHSMTTTFFSQGANNYIAIAPNNGRVYVYQEVEIGQDSVVPTITLPDANPTSRSAVTFDLVFDKSVPDFNSLNVAVTGDLGGSIYIIDSSDPAFVVLVNLDDPTIGGTVGIELLPNFNDGTGIPYDGNNSQSDLYTIVPGTGGGAFDGDYNEDGFVNAADVTAFAQDIVDGLFN